VIVDRGEIGGMMMSSSFLAARAGIVGSSTKERHCGGVVVLMIASMWYDGLVVPGTTAKRDGSLLAGCLMML
jgi:hypothetical protein